LPPIKKTSCNPDLRNNGL